jgi:hypothetical protein
MSGRTRDVEAWIKEEEARRGRLSSRVRAARAPLTRAPTSDLAAAEIKETLDPHGSEFKFGSEAIEEIRRESGAEPGVDNLRADARTS